MTRPDSSHDFWRLELDLSHVEKNGDSIRLSFFCRMTRLESQSMARDSSRRHFYKISDALMDKSRSFAHKEMSIFCFRDDQDWHKFFVLAV